MIDTDIALAAILDQLNRIATAMEALVAAQTPATPPDFVRGIGEYATFDWSSINAHVIERDEYGPSVVEFRGKAYKRRSPENKYDPVIYFSRAYKDENDAITYERLITFKEFKPAEPLARKAEASAAAAAQKAPTPTASSKQSSGSAPSRPVQQQTPPPPPPAPEPLPWDPEDDFEQLPSASQAPAQAAALAQARQQQGGLPFRDQGTAVLWAAKNPHYQKPDGSPDYLHITGSIANLCKRLGCSDRDVSCWGEAWVKHVQAK